LSAAELSAADSSERPPEHSVADADSNVADSNVADSNVADSNVADAGSADTTVAPARASAAPPEEGSETRGAPDTSRQGRAERDVRQRDEALPDAAPEAPPQQDTTARASPPQRVLVDADSLSAFQRDGESLQDLVGSVFVRQDSTQLRSLRALRYLQRDSILFTGRVRLFERGDSLYADTLRYNRRREIGRATGNVRLTDGRVVVFAPTARYDAAAKRTLFPDSIILVDSARVLRASSGLYVSDEERAEFYGNVRMTEQATGQPDTTTRARETLRTYMEADSVTYFRKTDVMNARGDVFIERRGGADDPDVSASDRTYLLGNRIRNDERQRISRAVGRALLMQIQTDSLGQPTDTLFTSARRLRATRSDTLRRVVATTNVRIWNAGLAAVADSAVYDRFPAAPAADSASGLSASAQPDTSAPPDTTGRPSREETRLFKQPVVWFDNSQLTGHPIRVIARNRSLDSVYVDTDAFAVQEDSATQRLQQLKGRSMTASFRRDSLRRLVAQPTAETIWFRSTDAGELDGAIRASGDRIALLFRDGAITKAGVYGGVRSNYFQKEHVPEPFTLDGLRWMPERAPTKDEFLRQERLYRRFPTMRPPPAPAPTPAIPPDSLQTTRPSAPAARPPADSTAVARPSASTSSSLP
jgi:hypothetical protein